MKVRLVRPEDRRYVAATWVRSFADVSPWSKSLTRREHGRIVDALLDRPTVATVVLYANDDRAIQAWACAEPGDVLHYVYVPPELRGHGFARQAVREALSGYPPVFDVSHPWPCRRHGRCRDVLCHGRGTRTRWNPYALAPTRAFTEAA